ncbi:MAG: hypothetical protein K9L86_01180 [Candidatus Omnitrophica bacterium]|nr:hypothetical protein [Candidatus Omnitrophota bacterium]
MVRNIDSQERENEILGLIIESYIEQSKPISSAYLCDNHKLNCSPATIRNVMLSLERKGLISHIHTSSGRVPTKQGFKHYVESLKQEELQKQQPSNLDFHSLPESNIEEAINYSLDSLASLSGYASLIAVSGQDERFSYRGMRFILEQPEFEDISKLRHIIYALEVRMIDFQHLLFDYIDENIKILIGDEIGFEEISDCSLIVSGIHEKGVALSLALLGPMRMNYSKAASCLNSVRNQLREVVEEFV